MESYSDSKDFIYDELKKQYGFLKTTKFGKLYEEFNEKDEYDQTVDQKCQKIKEGLSIPEYYYEIPNKFCNILHRVIVKINNIQNDLLEEITNNDKMHCIYLKYWLYDQIGNSDTKGMKDQSNKLKSIYAFMIFYYSHIKDIHEKQNVICKYSNFFGKGLKAFYESISECSNNKKEDEYCKEFKEFQKIYKLDKLYWKNSTLKTEYNYSALSKDNCPLVIDSHENPIIISYRDKNNILYLSNEPIDFQNSTIIPTSSAIGAAVGISAFLLYLYKFTNIRSLFGRGKQKDNTSFLNGGEGAHDFTFPISEPEHTNLVNTEYKISYYSTDNS
ncbi:PIR Superfamily Protein [Plasmodium ovale curtisi]|uniref:PIR Superfamily Protein n=1 Tax=Plasmodium ovale curtisi TaxID=864141 RepID=A0A1A8X9C3_PLAOA|nr:PIR Superfamily Protein [Plasmodium ovale curtisi]